MTSCFTPSELAVTAAWDAGERCIATIAAQTGVSRAQTEHVVKRLCFDVEAIDVAHASKMQLGSLSLLASIRLEQAKRGVA